MTITLKTWRHTHRLEHNDHTALIKDRHIFRLKNPLGDRRILYVGNDLHCATAVLTGLDVDLEHAIEAFRPCHGRVLFGVGSLLCSGASLAAPGRGDLAL